MVPARLVFCGVVPVALRYCTVQPVTSMGALVGLYSSMKSLVYVALALPPPPYTSLITMFVPAMFAWAVGATKNWKPVTASAAETRTARRARRGDRGAGMKSLRRLVRDDFYEAGKDSRSESTRWNRVPPAGGTICAAGGVRAERSVNFERRGGFSQVPRGQEFFVPLGPSV